MLFNYNDEIGQKFLKDSEDNYITEFSFNEVGAEPYEYVVVSDATDSPITIDIEKLIYQAVEIDGLDDTPIDLYIETTFNGKCVHEAQYRFIAHTTRTDSPSKYINWTNKIPYVFAIDRQSSWIEFVPIKKFK